MEKASLIVWELEGKQKKKNYQVACLKLTEIKLQYTLSQDIVQEARIS